MKLLLAKIKQYFPFINRRAINEFDLDRVIKRQKIKVYRLPLNVHGYYIPPEKSDNKKPCIYINSRLSWIEQFINTIHELIHHLLHVSRGKTLFSRRESDPLYSQKEYYENLQEKEARYLTAILLMPKQEFLISKRLPADEQNYIYRLVFIDRAAAWDEWEK